MLRLIIASLPILALGLATLPATARTSCDTYGRCFDFVGPNDRLDNDHRLWQRTDLANPAAEVQAAADAPAADVATADAAAGETPAPGLLGDPLALAHGTMGEPLESLATDD